MKIIFLIFNLFILYCCNNSAQQIENKDISKNNLFSLIKEGDIIFQTSKSTQSIVI